ncbi:ATP-binding cassette domain-containing protein [Bosea sp. (in: a-proteobacteria)]|uniref:ABC transporter ATP-binding protein n=1 Tax=Bosea sp. (in: a-proteobacteria) TaxID=1871050 RepID=UPI001AC7436B|nr:ATP-binding cassette domain-containing protein [Bosea sp. (in: a-proteobacteria)]MBN9437168.1 ATP-binding cassette domain-containing protein [Bosea sp. (in: a-proteobacteria)]
MDAADQDSAGPVSEFALRVRDLRVVLDDKTILDGLDLDIRRGEILGVIGASGSGKSVLARTILGLLPKAGGVIEIFGQDLDAITQEQRRALEQRCGVMFQHGALFSSLTIAENIQLPMRELLHLSPALMTEMAMLKLEMVGLPGDAAEKYPAQLSGGMTKRAALARALALDPEVLFLDEPTSGLDPIAADSFDQLLLTLKASLNLTVMMITHDLSSLHATCDRIAAIARGKVIAVGTLRDLLAHDDPWLRGYFAGERGRTIFANELPARADRTNAEPGSG